MDSSSSPMWKWFVWFAGNRPRRFPMLRDQAGKILGIHISEADRYREKPLYEAIVEKCRELHIAGATVFRGLEGYGETGELHTAHLVWHEQPIVIAIVDSAESLARLVPAVEEMMY